MIAHFKNLVEFKVDLCETLARGLTLLLVAFHVLGVPWSPMAHADQEEPVQVLKRTPSETDPLYETAEVEGGVRFYVPKGMTFVRKDGVIGPSDIQSFLLKRIIEAEDQVEALKERVTALEKRDGTLSDKKSQRSL